MLRTAVHTIAAALFGILYVLTWSAVHIGSIATPPAGFGPSRIGPAGKEQPHDVRHVSAQRRHLPAPKIQISCPDSPPPTGHRTFELPWVLFPVATTVTAASLFPIAFHPARAPPLV